MRRWLPLFPGVTVLVACFGSVVAAQEPPKGSAAAGAEEAPERLSLTDALDRWEVADPRPSRAASSWPLNEIDLRAFIGIVPAGAGLDVKARTRAQYPGLNGDTGGTGSGTALRYTRMLDLGRLRGFRFCG